MQSKSIKFIYAVISDGYIICTELIQSLPLLIWGHPLTPLRWLGVVLFGYINRSEHGTRLSLSERKQLALAFDLGCLLNRACDHKPVSWDNFRKLRRKYGANNQNLKIFLRAIWDQEHARPLLPNASAEMILKYRKDSIHCWIAGLAAIVSIVSEIDCTKNPNQQREHTDRILNPVYALALLTQLIDDLLDKNVDVNLRLPTFMTALQKEKTLSLRDLVNGLAKKQFFVARPVLLATYYTLLLSVHGVAKLARA